ncbi:hypothetical protein Cni_G01451 [Canna indica]|uniref:Polymerase nucleotidyl transferase domain-containing protein n=1 Tax=Canna indica TaxID=4628 RepID=A0AAQ3PY95_9LILI|nr:hypothetical protein Cni_G01451 [Canna indica]
MEMGCHRRLDSLTAHIALYHSASSKPSDTSPSPRAAVLRWFSALSTANRQAAITVVDRDFLRVLLQMLARLRRHGHGFFFLLPDLPSPSLPSVCFRRSHGLLSRAAAADASERNLAASLLLFASRDDSPVLDAVTVSEDLVLDVDRFVAVMDGISGGRFLRGEANGLAVQWAELPWLKDKGYYSLEVFVANRLEVALRLSWLSSQGGKKLKGGKAAKEKAAAAGLAANAFWRKKGCVDWWAGLDPGGRKKIIEAFFGKAAKYLVNEISKESELTLKNELCLYKLNDEFQLRYGPIPNWMRSKRLLISRKLDFYMDFITVTSLGMPRNLAKYLNCLTVLQDMSSLVTYHLSEHVNEAILFSTLPSAETISDLILRKLQGVLMVIYTNYINVELLGDAKSKTIPNKSQEKSNTSSLKGKKKSRGTGKLGSTPKATIVDCRSCKPSEVHGCRAGGASELTTRLCSREETPLQAYNQKAITTNIQEDPGNGTPSAENDNGNVTGLFNCKSRTNKKKSGRKRAKNKVSCLTTIELPQLENKNTDHSPLATEIEMKEVINPDGLNNQVAANPLLKNVSLESSARDNSYGSYKESALVDDNEKAKCMKEGCNLHNTMDNCVIGVGCCTNSNKSEIHYACKCYVLSVNTVNVVPEMSSGSSLINNGTFGNEIISHSADSSRTCLQNENRSQLANLSFPMHEARMADKSYNWPQVELSNSENICAKTSHSAGPINQEVSANDDSPIIQNDSKKSFVYNQTYPIEGRSYEWPAITPQNFASFSSQHVPAATERLHLDVGHEWPAYRRQSFMCSRHQARVPSIEGGCNRILPSLTLPMSLDWPPMVKSCSRPGQSFTVSYDSGYNSMLHSSFCTGFSGNALQNTGSYSENDRVHSGDVVDVYDMKNMSDLAEDTESYWLSEDETETHMLSGRDFNQFFGGGVMYWNPAEHVGSGFSRPPSHSSDDSAWAWHEADLNRAIDDMVGMPGISSYNTNGLASPTATTFCSPLDAMGPGHQSVGYAVAGNDITGKVLNSSAASDTSEEKASKSLNNSPGVIEGVKGDTLPFSMLRPIIVPNMSRRGSRSEFKVGYEHKSPCVPSTRRDTPQIKRPPSPVVLCVPRVPRPPPPSPVGESRKRGFPIVRSGSSSPRHWGVRSWYSDESSSEETQRCFDGAEVVWPSWRNKGLTTNPMVRSIHGSLLTDRLFIPQLAFDQEHPDVALPLQPPESLNCSSTKASLSIVHNLLHEEIDCFCKQVAAENLIKKPYVNWAVKRVTRSLQVLWPRSRTNIFGSNATGLALPTSDVDLVVSLPPVRNLEPIKEAGILEGRNGIKETCLQHAARYLGNQEWVRNDSLKTIENTAIPVIMLVAEVPNDIDISSKNSSMVDVTHACSTMVPVSQNDSPHSDHSGSDSTSFPVNSKMRKDDTVDVKSIRLDISFKSSSHTGLQTSELVRELTQQFPASVPLALVLKKFLADRSLDHAYSGGLSSYCLVLLIIRFLQHQHHVGRSNNQNLGGLLMGFLYFFGYVFDPRQMRVSIQGSGIYMNRERGLSIDPIHIDDPLHPYNNVGRNCFRIHQCIKAFADAYSVLENELPSFSGNSVPSSTGKFRLLQKIIPRVSATCSRSWAAAVSETFTYFQKLQQSSTSLPMSHLILQTKNDSAPESFHVDLEGNKQDFMTLVGLENMAGYGTVASKCFCILASQFGKEWEIVSCTRLLYCIQNVLKSGLSW